MSNSSNVKNKCKHTIKAKLHPNSNKKVCLNCPKTFPNEPRKNDTNTN